MPKGSFISLFMSVTGMIIDRHKLDYSPSNDTLLTWLAAVSPLGQLAEKVFVGLRDEWMWEGLFELSSPKQGRALQTVSSSSGLCKR